MKKVLIIVYHFPPVGSAPQAIRTAKLVKYLPRYGWVPYILTLKSYDIIDKDTDLLKEMPEDIKIYRTLTFEPNRFVNKIINKLENKEYINNRNNNQDANKLANYLKKLKSLIGATFFIPDRRIGWLPFALYRGRKIIRNEGVDLIYSVSPPETAHLVGYLLKKMTKKPLITGFDDPWIGIYYDYDTSGPKFSLKIQKRIERKILLTANKVITATEPITENLRKIYHDINKNNYSTIISGYDAEDFQNINVKKTNKFTLAYTGGFYARRHPRNFLNALAELLKEKPDLIHKIKVIFAGYFGEENKKIISHLSLNEVIDVVGVIPHRECINIISNANALLLIVATGLGAEVVSTSKIFEYLAVKKPILCIAPECVAAEIIRSSSAGIIVNPDDIGAIKDAIYNLYLAYSSNELSKFTGQIKLEKYDYKNLSKQLAEVFNSLVG